MAEWSSYAALPFISLLTSGVICGCMCCVCKRYWYTYIYYFIKPKLIDPSIQQPKRNVARRVKYFADCPEKLNRIIFSVLAIYGSCVISSFTTDLVGHRGFGFRAPIHHWMLDIQRTTQVMVPYFQDQKFYLDLCCGISNVRYVKWRGDLTWWSTNILNTFAERYK